jgi:hypothetical protein
MIHEVGAAREYDDYYSRVSSRWYCRSFERWEFGR